MTAAGQRPGDEAGLDTDSSIDAVQALYDRWARLYDWNPVLALVRPARERAVAAMGLEPGDTVVDMGTGTGANLPILSEAVGPGGRVIGLDVSPGMLDRARERVDRTGRDNVTLVRGDVRDPPIGPVDGILSTFVVVMYADPDQLVDTWATHLDGGTLANLYAGPSDRRYAPVVNALLGLYLRLFEEGWNSPATGSSPLDILVARGDRVRLAMRESADRVEHHALAFGLVHLDVGSVRP